MKMAKASKRDIEAAGELMGILNGISNLFYPNIENGDDEESLRFDEDNPEHLRKFYDKVKATLDKSPGYPGRVIGGMCHVILWDKNEIVDPDSDVLDLHPKIISALAAQPLKPIPTAERAPTAEDGEYVWALCMRHGEYEKVATFTVSAKNSENYPYWLPLTALPIPEE